MNSSFRLWQLIRFLDRKVSGPSPVTPRVSSALAIPKSHPHARKQSTFEGQSLVQDVSTPTTPNIHPPPTSTPYTLSLDPIKESATPIPYATPAGPATPDILDANPPNAPAFREDIFSSAHVPPTPQPRPSRGNGYTGAHSRRRSSLGFPGIGLPSNLVSSPTNGFSPLSQTFAAPGSEILLWAYARLVGTLEIDESIVPPAELDSLRAKLRTGGAIGGGRMDIAERAPAAGVSAASPVGLTGGLFSTLFGGGGGSPSGFATQSSPTMMTPPQSAVSLGVHTRSPSAGYISSFFTGSPGPGVTRARSMSHAGRYGGSSGGGSGLLGGAATAGEDPKSLPTLEVQPSVLAVDLNLAPGETRSCMSPAPSISIQIPTYHH